MPVRVHARRAPRRAALRAALSGAVVSLGLVVGAAQGAAGDRAFGVKPWLHNPAPERPSALERQRATGYRSKLQGEVRRFELRGERSDPRALDRHKSFRRELSRIRRATQP